MSNPLTSITTDWAYALVYLTTLVNGVWTEIRKKTIIKFISFCSIPLAGVATGIISGKIINYAILIGPSYTLPGFLKSVHWMGMPFLFGYLTGCLLGERAYEKWTLLCLKKTETRGLIVYLVTIWLISGWKSLIVLLATIIIWFFVVILMEEWVEPKSHTIGQWRAI
jgi:hypothetical protein